MLLPLIFSFLSYKLACPAARDIGLAVLGLMKQLSCNYNYIFRSQSADLLFPFPCEVTDHINLTLDG